MNLNKCLKTMEYLHATLHFAVLIPLVYAVAELSDPAGTGVFYLKCLLVAVPVVLTDVAVRRTKSLAVYSLCCAVVCAALAGSMRLFLYASVGTGELSL